MRVWGSKDTALDRTIFRAVSEQFQSSWLVMGQPVAPATSGQHPIQSIIGRFLFTAQLPGFWLVASKNHYYLFIQCKWLLFIQLEWIRLKCITHWWWELVLAVRNSVGHQSADWTRPLRGRRRGLRPQPMAALLTSVTLVVPCYYSLLAQCNELIQSFQLKKVFKLN